MVAFRSSITITADIIDRIHSFGPAHHAPLCRRFSFIFLGLCGLCFQYVHQSNGYTPQVTPHHQPGVQSRPSYFSLFFALALPFVDEMPHGGHRHSTGSQTAIYTVPSDFDPSMWPIQFCSQAELGDPILVFTPRSPDMLSAPATESCRRSASVLIAAYLLAGHESNWKRGRVIIGTASS